ncbi:TPA: recombination protein NinG [Escherichia coli]|nr:recombination protein NinG [Escherichia coli]EJQ8079234.1 recombination protein NinG [Escherichia coli]HAZ3577481.1 recombination protein NinG [Escherichia coli]HBA7950871.1 recombination protein NinG [Escherichia coli]HBA9573861.1 recombination protein NinG [Escherichia coli]
MAKRPRRKCKVCGEWFHPAYDNVRWCSPEHGTILAIELRTREKVKALARKIKAQKEAEKAARRRQAERRKAVRPLSWFIRQAQQAFNAFIRYRDRDLPCISCGRHHEGQYHAGHFRTTGAHPELRFDEDNCHKQCAPCNNHLSGNLTAYRPALIARIGQSRFDVLMGPHEIPKWTRDDYIRIRDEYRRKLRELKKSSKT